MREFFVRSRSPRKGRSDSSVGIVPVRLFAPSTRRVRFVKLPMMAAGKEPEEGAVERPSRVCIG